LCHRDLTRAQVETIPLFIRQILESVQRIGRVPLAWGALQTGITIFVSSSAPQAWRKT
jgi:hypothetical protein